MLVKLKQKGNCGIENYSRMPNPDSGVQIVGTGACFNKRTRGKRGEISSRFFSSSFFLRRS